MIRKLLSIMLSVCILLTAAAVTSVTAGAEWSISDVPEIETVPPEEPQPYIETLPVQTEPPEDDSKEYPVNIGGVQVTSANADHITGDTITGDVSYDHATRTLTLNNAEIDGGDNYQVVRINSLISNYIGAAIIAGEDLTVNLIGSNKVRFVRKSSDMNYWSQAIYMTGHDLTFTGSGSAELTGFESAVKGVDSLAVDEGCTVSMIADKGAAYHTCETLITGSMTVNGTLSVRSYAYYTRSYAIQANAVDVGVSGELTAVGSVSANSSTDAYSIYLDGSDLNVHGKVNIGKNEKNSYGVYAVNGGRVCVWETGSLTAQGGNGAIRATVTTENDKLIITAGDNEENAERISPDSLASQKYVHI
ncbi:MAG: hypothetical protein IJU73_01100, partial [Ruminococcus sp.]|nr:hypothetical protein [Ruminococcus sp.]